MLDQKELLLSVSTATLYNPTGSSSADSPSNNTATQQKNKFTDADLPAHDRDWYEAFIYTKSLGVLFFNAPKLLSSLFLNITNSDDDDHSQLITIFQNRPVVSYIVEDSPACHAGIQIGSILIKVNGNPVNDSMHAMQLIKSINERPLSLLFYRANIKLFIPEGNCLTCYNSSELTIPSYQSKLKMKYVVIGGVISKPWFLSMYKSKAEYDIAVIEIQSACPISVKVKQFCLKDSKVLIQKNEDGYNNPQSNFKIGKVSYTDEPRQLYYIVINPSHGYPIKIASTNLSQLTTILNAVKRINKIHRNEIV